MVRICNVNIPDNKSIYISLSYIYGIGQSLAKKILKTANIDIQKKTKDLTAMEISRLQEIIDNNYKIEGDLRREIQSNVRRLKDINAYRGIRHARKLPVRGQRTKTNSRTVRGNVRRTVGSGKRKLELK
ncbi:MAG TPA: 30S ribosomal protein S13 [Candidatus Paceibacterota bacterium]|jgi:small subunit ribosomal protein S13|nr:30S ribosomal protein S13 [Candidatus Paceibacterota bacterium]HPD55221.1 30S ribosomal protein S13 [Candidatus Paceibacterota bacterium]HQM35055.1 30S ribosomal protein S13 [Candidatus Paceibacterota bacterium]